MYAPNNTDRCLCCRSTIGVRRRMLKPSRSLWSGMYRSSVLDRRNSGHPGPIQSPKETPNVVCTCFIRGRSREYQYWRPLLEIGGQYLPRRLGSASSSSESILKWRMESKRQVPTGRPLRVSCGGGVLK